MCAVSSKALLSGRLRFVSGIVKIDLQNYFYKILTCDGSFYGTDLFVFYGDFEYHTFNT